MERQDTANICGLILCFEISCRHLMEGRGQRETSDHECLALKLPMGLSARFNVWRATFLDSESPRYKMSFRAKLRSLSLDRLSSPSIVVMLLSANQRT